eukprot:6389147-Lingulodinium_polyedra.AAC.1
MVESGLPKDCLQGKLGTKKEAKLKLDVWTASTAGVLWLFTRWRQTLKQQEDKQKCLDMLVQLLQAGLPASFPMLLCIKKFQEVELLDGQPIGMEKVDSMIFVNQGIVDMNK